MAIYQEPPIKASDIHDEKHSILLWFVIQSHRKTVPLSDRVEKLDSDGRLDMSLSDRGIKKDDYMNDNFSLGNMMADHAYRLSGNNKYRGIYINGRKHRMGPNGLSTESIALPPSPLSMFMKYKRFAMIRRKLEYRKRMRKEMKRRYITRKVINK